MSGERRYYDLNVAKNAKCALVINKLFEFGFEGVAVSVTVDLDEIMKPIEAGSSKEDRKTKNLERQRRLQQLLTSFNPLDYLTDTAAAFPKSRGRRPVLLSRLTLQFAVENNCKLLLQQHSSLISKFNLLVACPRSESAFTYCCEFAPIDMIMLDLEEKPSSKISAKQVRMAIRRGLHFELSLTPMIRSSTSREFAASHLAQLLPVTSGGRNLVVTGGARDTWDARNPLALSAVAHTLGVASHRVAACLRDNPCAVVEHGLVRTKTAFGAAAVLHLSGLPGVRRVDTVPVATHSPTSHDDQKKHKRKKVVTDDKLQHKKSKKNL